MSHAVEQILAQIDALSPSERSELAYAFLCSLERSEEIDKAWEAEVTRRLQDTRTMKQQAIPAQELFAELRQRVRE